MAASAAERKKLADEAIARAIQQPPGRALIPQAVKDTLNPMRRTPFIGHVAYYGVIGVLVLAEVVEPIPTAIMMAAAHFLVGNGNPVLKEAGEALKS